MLPEVKGFLEKKCNVDYSYETHSLSKTQENKVHYPHELNEEKVQEEVDKQYKRGNVQSSYYEKMLMVNKEKDKAKEILDNVSDRGLPGVVDTIMLYLSHLDSTEKEKDSKKKADAIAVRKYYIHLLSFENMDDLRNRVKSTYNYDLFYNSSFLSQYIKRFGLSELSDSDPVSIELYESACMRRIDFFREHQLPQLANELYDLLKEQSKREVFNKDLFIEYIQLQSKSYDEKEKKSYTQPRSLSSFTKNFLVHFFPEEDPMQFTHYLINNEVMRIYEEQSLLKGYDITTNYLSASTVESLRMKEICQLLPSNKLFYKTGEDVQIGIELKNIKQLSIHVFEINTLAYYQANHTSIPISIDIDGLVPFHKEEHVYGDLSPMIAHREFFTFPMIQQRGVYVVDFIANHTNCRFLVHMGCLHVLRRECLSGYALTILDEHGRRLEENVKVLLDNREYELNDNHEIIVPYLPETDSARTSTLYICQHDGIKTRNNQYSTFR